MTDPKALKHFKTTSERLRAIFTNFTADVDGKAHKRILDLARDRINNGMSWCVKNAAHYGAVDLMWDAHIRPEMIPYTQYMQGRIKQEHFIKAVETLGCAEKFTEEKEITDDKGMKEKVKQLNLPKFVEVTLNLGRSYVSRRLFAQTNKYDSQRPFLRFESRFATQVGKLRGAAMSELAQMMSDGFGYPGNQEQFSRDMLKYGHSVVFPACAWEQETSVRMKDGSPETVIVREGVPFVTVHPSRVISDMGHPLRTLNTDTGCEYIGHFDVRNYSTIEDNPELFFNTDKVQFSSMQAKLVDAHPDFFSLQFAGDPVNMKPPASMADSTADLHWWNDRESRKGLYSTNDRDRKVFLTDLRMKLKPIEFGLGDYPHPVWLRLLMASDTIVFAEWLPSLPAFVASFNECDSRLLNLGQMHEIAPLQDQASNIMSHLLMAMRHSLLRIVGINRDVVDDEAFKTIVACLGSHNFFEKPHLLGYSMSETAELQVSPKGAVMDLLETKGQDDFINNAFRAIVQILQLLERLLMLSPQEQGQSAPREITATESAMIEGTTSAVYSAISAAIDRARGAMKKIVYESTMAYASGEVTIPIAQTFSRKTIEKAGFRFLDEEEQETEGQYGPSQPYTVLGTKELFEHDYIFTSRDGNDRPTNQATANTLIALLAQVLPLIGPEAIGKERIFEIINEIFRLVGVYTLRLEVGEQESTQMQVGEQIQQLVGELVPAVRQVAEKGQQNEEQLLQIAGTVQKLADGLGKISEMLAPQSASPTPAAA